MDILEKVKELYPEFGTTKTAKMLKVRQSTIKKIVENNNLEKNRRININDFYNIKSKEICYFLGLLWADGHVSKRNYTISIECNGDDMLEFKKVLDVFGKWSYYDRKRIDIRAETKPVTNAYIYDNLLHHFLVENDYLEKSIKSPNKILSKIPKYLISYFLLGLIDGDGCFYYKEKLSNQFYLTGTIDQDWSSFIIILESIDVKVKHIKIQNKNKSSFIRVTNVKDIKKIGDFIYKSINEDQIGLKRKYDKYKLIINNILEKERNIDYIRENIHKSKRDLSIDLGISIFKISKIINELKVISN
jgi:plasmid maintenance system antidote protein VapI